jgi:hypothetical protein
MSSPRSHLTFANVVAALALFISLGGVSWAAVSLPKASVGSRELKANAVGTRNVRDGSLLSSDFKAGELLRARKGDLHSLQERHPGRPDRLPGERHDPHPARGTLLSS